MLEWVSDCVPDAMLLVSLAGVLAVGCVFAAAMWAAGKTKD